MEGRGSGRGGGAAGDGEEAPQFFFTRDEGDLLSSGADSTDQLSDSSGQPWDDDSDEIVSMAGGETYLWPPSEGEGAAAAAPAAAAAAAGPQPPLSEPPAAAAAEEPRDGAPALEQLALAPVQPPPVTVSLPAAATTDSSVVQRSSKRTRRAGAAAAANMPVVKVEAAAGAAARPMGPVLPVDGVDHHATTLPKELAFALLNDGAQQCGGRRPNFLRLEDGGRIFLERTSGTLPLQRPRRRKGVDKWSQGAALQMRKIEGVTFGKDGGGEVWLHTVYGTITPGLSDAPGFTRYYCNARSTQTPD